MMRPSAPGDIHTVFLVDSWSAFRRSLRLFVEAAGHRVVGEADTVEGAAATENLGAADVVILDPGAGPGELVAALATLRRAAPAAHVVLLTAEPLAPWIVRQSFQLGVGSYLTKNAGPADVLNAIAVALSRSFVMLPRHLIAEAAHGERPRLTVRERAILALVAEGYSDRQIADINWVTRQTIDFHLASVFRKLGVRNRATAVQAAERYGLIQRSLLWPEIPPDAAGEGRAA